MTADKFRELALEIPGAVGSSHHGHADFRLTGRVFASLGHPDDDHGMIKLPPEQQSRFLKKEADVFKPCAGVWGKQGATSVDLVAAKVNSVRAALEAASQNILQRKKPIRNHGRNFEVGKVKTVHPHAVFWESLENDPTFVLRPMFGTKAVYVCGKIVLCFSVRKEPWRGVLVATEQTQHTSLRAELPALEVHPILPKWLYVPESSERFEATVGRLVQLVRSRDPRIGVVPRVKAKRRVGKFQITLAAKKKTK